MDGSHASCTRTKQMADLWGSCSLHCLNPIHAQAGARCLQATGELTHSMLEKKAARKSILMLSDGHAVKKSAAERSPR
jgi:hypothetical protein